MVMCSLSYKLISFENIPVVVIAGQSICRLIFFALFCKNFALLKTNFHNSFTPDGFFWGQQFQEESVKEYKSQDLKFVKFCKQAIKDGKTVVYTCSW